jgi:hypothetical protein
MLRLLVVGALAVLSQTARAGVVYSFTEETYGTSWSFKVPAILTETTSIPASELFDIRQPSNNLQPWWIGPTTISEVEIMNPRQILECKPEYGGCSISVQVNEHWCSSGTGCWDVGVGYNFSPVAPLDHFGIYNPCDAFPGSPCHAPQVLTISDSADVPEPAPCIVVSSGVLILLISRFGLRSLATR